MSASNLTAYLPRILLYPLRGHCPPVILLVTLLLGIGSRSIVALVPLIVGVLWAAHYAVRVIESTSYGHASPPRLTGDALMLTDAMTWSALAAPALLLVLHLQAPGVAVMLLAALLPAHWIALATTRSLLAASHPLRLLHIIGVTGVAYVGSCALLIGAALLGRWLSAHVSSLLVVAAWLYLLFAACHLLGFVAYHRHERLGLGVHVVRPSRERELDDEQTQRLDALLAQITVLRTRRDNEAAAQLIHDTAPGPADARRFHEELYERLKAIPARGLALTQAARMIPFLLDRKQADRALEIFENALDLDADFRCESPLHLPPLAERAFETRQTRLLGRLLESAAESFADDPALKLLDGVHVRKLMELDRDETAARDLLASLGDFEGHPRATELGAYARVLAVGTAPRTMGPPGESEPRRPTN
jgi:hypothetical protein